MTPKGLVLSAVSDTDFEPMVAIRMEAMRESLERLGRYDPARARERLRAGFVPEFMHHISRESTERVGFITLKPEGAYSLRLDHLYVLPSHQSMGIGAWALDWAKLKINANRSAILVTVLKQSDVIRFYEKHGFLKTGEEEWDLHYRWRPVGSAS